MGILDRILRAGEGKKLKALAGHRSRHQRARARDARRCPTTRCRPRPPSSASGSTTARTLDDLLIEAFAVIREAATPRDRPAPLRRAAHGRRRPALRLGRRDEDRRGQDPRVDAAGLPQRPRRQGRPPRHGQRLPGPPRRRVDGPDPPLARPRRRPRSSPGSRTTPTEKRAQYAADITYGTNNEFGFDYLRDNMAHDARPTRSSAGHNYAIVDEVDSILIDEARTPLIISGRVADAAKLYYQFASIVRAPASATSTTRSTRTSASSSPLEAGIEKVEAALGVENLYDDVSARTSSTSSGRAEGQGAVQARQGLHRPERRGEDRRRVHRPHPRGPALVRGHPPGGRGQGGREDQGGEPDPRHDHAAELLPHVRQARRHDRHGRNRGRRADEHLRASASCRSRRNRPLVRASTRPTSSTRPRTAKFDAVVDDIAERYETGQPVLVGTVSRSRSPSTCRGCCTSAASPTRC